jgi:signal transduction histidine kinase
MLRIYDCIVGDHDLRLVALAVVVCVFACFTAVSLEMRAKIAARHRHWWLVGVGVATGSGIWATHFIAMLAFRPDLPVAYEPIQTLLSLLIAMVLTGLGFAVGVYFRESRTLAALIGGSVIGIGVFCMHFVGMAATVVPATIDYDWRYAGTALLLSVGFSVLAVRTVASGDGMLARLNAANLLAAGIATLHFTAMAAVTLHPDPSVPIPETTMPTEWMAFGVAVITLLVLATALISSLVDQRLGAHAEREAARLRVTVAELEETKTRLEQTSADLMRSLEAAAAGSQAKSQFLAAMSHELRTPLNAVIGFSQALNGGFYGELNERQKEYLGHVQSAGEHLLELVNDVLDLSKMDANRLDLDETALSAKEVIASATRLLLENAASAHVAVEQEIADDLPYLRADERRVRQILLNLLSNAIKFTPSGGSITLRAFETQAGLAIAVTDTGIGIAAEDIPTALERFGQVDNRLARKFEGTGLGLPLCKRLMELHDGTLEITSVVGSGTTVTVTFPPARIVRARQAA